MRRLAFLMVGFMIFFNLLFAQQQKNIDIPGSDDDFYSFFEMDLKPFFDEIRRFNMEMDRMMRRLMESFKRRNLLFKRRISPDFSFSYDTFNPKVNVVERDGKFIITVDLPGVDKDNLDVRIDNNVLIISGKREVRKEEKNEKMKYYCKEIYYGSFFRTIPLPKPVREDRIVAKYKNGVLTIIAPIDTSKKLPGNKIMVQ